MARRGRAAPVLVLLLALLATPAAASAPISVATDPSIPPEVEVSLMIIHCGSHHCPSPHGVAPLHSPSCVVARIRCCHTHQPTPS